MAILISTDVLSGSSAATQMEIQPRAQAHEAVATLALSGAMIIDSSGIAPSAAQQTAGYSTSSRVILYVDGAGAAAKLKYMKPDGSIAAPGDTANAATISVNPTADFEIGVGTNASKVLTFNKSTLELASNNQVLSLEMDNASTTYGTIVANNSEATNFAQLRLQSNNNAAADTVIQVGQGLAALSPANNTKATERSQTLDIGIVNASEFDNATGKRSVGLSRRVVSAVTGRFTLLAGTDVMRVTASTLNGGSYGGAEWKMCVTPDWGTTDMGRVMFSGVSAWSSKLNGSDTVSGGVVANSVTKAISFNNATANLKLWADGLEAGMEFATDPSVNCWISGSVPAGVVAGSADGNALADVAVVVELNGLYGNRKG